MTAFSIPKFSDINDVSTKTIIAVSNIDIDIKKLWENLPVTKYTLIPKKRGRKKKAPIEDPNKNITSGAIITLDHDGKIRGTDLKPKKKNKKSFRNALSIVMIIDKIKINSKISKNGKFQITGAKKEEYGIKLVKFIWSYIKDTDWYTYKEPIESPTLNIIFITVMTNIDFSVGFYVNREALDNYINESTDYISILELSYGYAGVNIKFPLKDIDKIPPLKITYKDKWSKVKETTYKDYLGMLSEKDRIKEVTKEDRYVTFLVFYSGKVIMSSRHIDFMEEYYTEFMNIIKRCKPAIEEKFKI